MTYGEAHDRFKTHFVRFNGEAQYFGGSTWKYEGLKLTENGEAINALVTYEQDRTTVVDLNTNKMTEIFL